MGNNPDNPLPTFQDSKFIDAAEIELRKFQAVFIENFCIEPAFGDFLTSTRLTEFPYFRQRQDTREEKKLVKFCVLS